MFLFSLLLVPTVTGQYCDSEPNAVVFSLNEKTLDDQPRLTYNVLNTHVEKRKWYFINRFLPSSITCVKLDEDVWDCQTKNSLNEAVIWKGHRMYCISNHEENPYARCRLTVDVNVSPRVMREIVRATHQAPFVAIIPLVFAVVVLGCLLLTFMCSLCCPRRW